MKIFLAKNAGYCFGVRDAVQLVPRISGKVPSTKGVLRKDG